MRVSHSLGKPPSVQNRSAEGYRIAFCFSSCIIDIELNEFRELFLIGETRHPLKFFISKHFSLHGFSRMFFKFKGGLF